jgi:hypothetical protein
VHEVGELSGEEKNKFREKYEAPVMNLVETVYGKVFASNPEKLAAVKKDFRDRFEHLENYRVYALMFQGEVVAFSTIKPIESEPGAVMSESTMVDPSVQKYSWDTAFLQKIFARESQNNTIRGKGRADNAAIMKILSDSGFTVDQEKPFEEYEEKYYKVAMKKIEKERG